MLIALHASREVSKNIAMAIPTVRKWRLNRPRAGVAYTGSVAQLERYAFQSLDVLQEHAGDVAGRSIIEIGPGDLLTSGLALLAAGATSYTSVDRFVGDYSRAEGKQWYAAVQQAWSERYPQKPWPNWLQASDFPEAYPDRVKSHDIPVEQADASFAADLVCSFQVGEHVSDIRAFARATANMLHPGGIAVHRVDFGPHDVWRSYADPLTFLRFSDVLWRAMGSARGIPNRYRAHEMIAAFRDVGLAVEVRGVERYSADNVDLKKVHPRFRQMPVEDVLVKTAYLVARKP